MAARPHQFHLDKFRLPDELNEFERLLGDSHRELSERGDVLPFFKSHQNLAALIGFNYSSAFPGTLLKSELGLFGDHACDLAVGDSEAGQFCFVEFEDASAHSVFNANGNWSARFEHGLSQIVDWFYLLSGNQHTPQFRSYFHSDLVDYTAMLVIGRDAFLNESQRHRLRWRSQNTLIAGKHIWMITFDELLSRLRVAVNLITRPPVRRAPRRK